MKSIAPPQNDSDNPFETTDEHIGARKDFDPVKKIPVRSPSMQVSEKSARLNLYQNADNPLWLNP
jgi:hypothetical protein